MSSNTCNEISLWNFVIIRVLPFLNTPKDLDPSYKIHLDFLGLFWKKKKPLCYNQRNTVREAGFYPLFFQDHCFSTLEGNGKGKHMPHDASIFKVNGTYTFRGRKSAIFILPFWQILFFRIRPFWNRFVFPGNKQQVIEVVRLCTKEYKCILVPYLFGYRTGFTHSRMTTTN